MAFQSFASPQNVLQIQRFANCLYNMQVGSETMSTVIDYAFENGFDKMLNDVYTVSFGSMTTAQVTETLLANFGIVAGKYGLSADAVDAARNYINGALDAAAADARGVAVKNLTVAWAGLEADGTYGAAATAWNAEVASAVNYNGTADMVAGAPYISMDDIILGADRDTLGGTDGADTFLADVVQVAGAQVNTLGTGDYLNGFDGIDTLDAQVAAGLKAGGGNMPIMPRTTSIERVELEAVFSDMEQWWVATDEVYVSAKNMAGVDFIGSDHSDADLIIQDLTVDEGEVTASMTIGMAYTGNANSDWDASDLIVLFDEDDLLAGTTQTPSKAYFYLLDEDGHDSTVGTGDYRPLLNIDREGIMLSHNGGPQVAIIIGELTGNDYTTAETHAAYADLLNQERLAYVNKAKTDAAYADYAFLEFVTIAVDPAIVTSTNTDLNLNVDVPAIVLTDTKGGVFSNLGYVRDANATGQFDVFGQFSTLQPGTLNELITVNVELEKVGRGGEGGELIIGGMNKDLDGDGDINEWGDGSALKPAGVEQFNVTVLGGNELPSSLSNLSSTNNALRVVNVVSEAGRTTANAADLLIGDLKDVQVFNAASFQGDLTLDARLTNEVVAKYMELQDDQDAPAADNAEFVYTLGAGNDNLFLNISKSNLEAAGTTTREDFELTISGGAGNDTIVTQIGDGVGSDADVWYINSKLNNTNDFANDVDPKAYLQIDAGAGNDTIHTLGAGDFVINAGAGNDTVYAENTGAMASWVFNAAVAATLQSDVNNSNAILSDGADLNTTFDWTVRVTFKGLVSSVTANSADNAFTDLELNQLIKKAINDNAVLSKLLVANDGPANILLVDSLIDGVTADALTIEIIEEDATVNALPVTYSTTFTAGTAGAQASDNEITPGLGDDVIVLGTSAQDDDNILYTAVNSGVDTIVNFLVGDGTVAGSDTLDFTALTGVSAGANVSLFGGFLAADGSVTVVNEAVGNDTAAEIQVLFNADAAEDATASEHIYIAVSAADADVAKAYLITDGIGADDAQVQLIGTIDLADVAWNTLVAANFA